jgi:hypothetical protein
LVPRRSAGTTDQPPLLEVSVVARTGSTGVGAGAARSGTGTGFARAAGAPVTVKSLLIGVSCVSQLCARHPSPKLAWMVFNSE